MVYTFTLIAWPGKVLAEKTLHADSIEEAISAFDPNDQTEDWTPSPEGDCLYGQIVGGANAFVQCTPGTN